MIINKRFPEQQTKAQFLCPSNAALGLLETHRINVSSTVGIFVRPKNMYGWQSFYQALAATPKVYYLVHITA